MADNYGLFWNSESGDRLYDADSFAEWLSHFFTTGVFKEELFVQATEGMKVSVSPGYANINGKVRFFETITNLNIEVANGVYPRIDTVVVERNDTNREITLKVIKGNYSGNNPEATAPVRTNVIHQIVLAKIYVGAGATAIYQKDITDTRMDSTLCGYVTATVENLSYDQMMAQWEDYYSKFKTEEMADFKAWYENIKNILDESTAGHLQAEIEATNKVVATKQDKAIKATITLSSIWTDLTQSVSVAGITANHNAILDVVTSTSNYEDVQNEWAKVYKAETYEGGIKFYAKEATSTALTIQVLAM
nr:MAG TPA: Receptor Binding Protein [Bacteriophage sp.]